jgi:hypothetical protein
MGPHLPTVTEFWVPGSVGAPIEAVVHHDDREELRRTG